MLHPVPLVGRLLLQPVSCSFPRRCRYCRPQCNETKYGVTVSSSQWPSNYNWPYVAAKYNVSYNGSTITLDRVIAAMEHLNTLDKLAESAELSVLTSIKVGSIIA